MTLENARLNRREFLHAGGAALALATTGLGGRATAAETRADWLIQGGRIATLDPARPRVEALAVKGDRVLAIGTEKELAPLAGPATRRLDLGGRTMIPGLNDSHTHPIRGGLNYNLELRWDGVSSLAEALERLRIQAKNTPPPQWVRVVGGFSEFQFREGRMPTLEELNTAAPETPVFILHLYGQALLNRAALRALGWSEDAPSFDRGLVQRDSSGHPTGLLVAKPSALLLYTTLTKAPRLAPEDQANSTRHFMRELNRLGITSALDAGGGGQHYPDDYAVIQQLADDERMTVRIGMDLFAQKSGEELADFRRWIGQTGPGAGDAFLRMVGAGENLTWAAADFENFAEPRPDLGDTMEAQLEPIVRLLAEHRWPFRIHATYDESITRFLSVFERVNREVPIRGLHWFLDHAETISDANLERVRALEGGIAVQHRMAFQGEAFVARYGERKARQTPPIRRMLEMGIPVGAGTDATRVSSYNPWVCLAWLVTGRTLGGMQLHDESLCLERDEALRLWTRGSAWFSSEEHQKGALIPGQLADATVLSKDFFSVPADEIQTIESVCTMVGGKVVYGKEAFAKLDPALPPVSPSWSPVARFGGAAPIEADIGHFRSAGHGPGCRHEAPFGGRGFGCQCFVA